ncbi:unnamed protein product [Linum tenue]|uniref:Uncharacterized protein n=1 Tax=Linum tenue TaxID=586396 RepID=A0AAV0K9H1_9ROSI|nr:unnamed protein product [Linum tenue]
MLTLARANYGPYGIDFPLGATGRFTNGVENLRNAQRLIGFQNFIPPFARARAPREVLRGVNFASGAAGIREETGNNLGSNDYLNNYFMSNFYTTSSDYTPKAFASVLLQDYANQLAVRNSHSSYPQFALSTKTSFQTS